MFIKVVFVWVTHMFMGYTDVHESRLCKGYKDVYESRLYNCYIEGRLCTVWSTQMFMKVHGLCDFKRFLLKLSLLPRGIGPQRADTVSGMMAS
jgi:hypothetical protein